MMGDRKLRLAFDFNEKVLMDFFVEIAAAHGMRRELGLGLSLLSVVVGVVGSCPSFLGGIAFFGRPMIPKKPEAFRSSEGVVGVERVVSAPVTDSFDSRLTSILVQT